MFLVWWQRWDSWQFYTAAYPRGLPKLVKQRYGTELRSQTLPSTHPEISIAIPSLLEELKCNTDNAHTFRTTTEPFRKSYEPRSKQKGDQFHNPRQTQWKKRKSCSICANTSRDDNHWLSECRYLSHADRQFMAKTHQTTQVFEAQGESDIDEDSDHEDSTSSAHLVSVRQSPYFSTFCGYHTVDITVDTGATGNMIREDVVKKLGGKISKSTQVASQATQGLHFRSLVRPNCNSLVVSTPSYLRALW